MLYPMKSGLGLFCFSYLTAHASSSCELSLRQQFLKPVLRTHGSGLSQTRAESTHTVEAFLGPPSLSSSCGCLKLSSWVFHTRMIMRFLLEF